MKKIVKKTMNSIRYKSICSIARRGTLPRFGMAAALLLLVAPMACVDPSVGDGGGRTITSNVTDWRDEVIYQVLIDRFDDGDYANNYNMDRRHLAKYQGGDWQGLLNRIPYLKELGVTTLWISPVVKNVEEDAGFASYHGYWTQDFTRVNPHFGDLAKLQETVDILHKNGFKVILDIVTNHIGQLFYYDINENGQPDDIHYGGNGPSDGSKNADLPGRQSRTSEWDPDYDRRGIRRFTSLGESGPAEIRWVFQPQINRTPVEPPEFQNPGWYHRKGRVTAWEYLKLGLGSTVAKYCTSGPKDSSGNFNPDLCDYTRNQELYGDFPGGLKDLRTELPDVRAALIRAFKYWITVGDFDGFRIDTLKHVEHGFWKKFCPAMRQHAAALGKKRFLMFGEAFTGIDQLLGDYTKDNQVDSVFYFSQKYIIDDVFKGYSTTDELKKLHDRRNTYYAQKAHAGGITAPPHEALIGFLDNHDVERFLHTTQWVAPKKRLDWTHAVNALHGALSYLFTTINIPNIYYGTEQQFFGGNDPSNREVMWRGNTTRGFKPFDTTNPTFKHIKALIKVRKDLAPLRRGTFNITFTTSQSGGQDEGIFAFERSYNGETVLVVINAAKCTTPGKRSVTENATTGVMKTSIKAKNLRNVYPDAETTFDVFPVQNGTVKVSVPCGGVKILVKRD